MEFDTLNSDDECSLKKEICENSEEETVRENLQNPHF